MKKIRLAVLMGGTSSERDISLISGKEVVKALNKDKYDIKVYDPATDLIKLAQDKDQIDVAFPVLHGPGGEDGTIQGFLELLELPYVGSKVLASALAMDKEMTKKVYNQEGIPTPKSITLYKFDKINLDKIKVPCVVKPVSQGSSVGTSIVKSKDGLKKAIDEAFKFEDRIMVEDYIEGMEITVSILGNKKPIALPVIEIIPPEGEFFNRQVKYNGATQEIVPARLSKQLTKYAQDIGIKVHQVLGCRGFSRTDIIIQTSSSKLQTPNLYVLETNTIPGMTRESLFPKAAKAAGISFPKLLDRLIGLALDSK